MLPADTFHSTRSVFMNKVYPDAKSALDGILKDGMMIKIGRAHV